MKKYLILSLLLIIYSCNKPDASGEIIDVIVGTKQPHSIHNLFKQVKYIKLETTKESLIGNISKVIIYKNKIYILDNRSPKNVLTFNMDGEFHSKLTRHGKGPGESMGITDFNIHNNTIYLFDWTLKKIMLYNLSGTLIKEEKVTIPMLNFKILKNGNFFALRERPGNESSNNKFNKLFLFSMAENKVLKEFHIEPVTEDINLHLDNMFYSTENGNILYWEFFNNTIYEFSGKNLSEKYKVNFGNHTLGADLLKKPLMERFEAFKDDKYAGIINNVIEDKNQLFFTFLHKEKLYTCIYNRKVDKTDIFSLKDEKTNIDNITIMTKTDDYYVAVIEPGKLDEQNILYSEIDNPYLILANRE